LISTLVGEYQLLGQAHLKSLLFVGNLFRKRCHFSVREAADMLRMYIPIKP
jgi:hypothetical protein